MTDHHDHEMTARAASAPLEHPMHAAGHDRHEGHSVAMFRDKFWLSLALTIPVVLLSPDVQEWLGYSIPAFPGIEYAAGDPRDGRLPVRRPRLPPRRRRASWPTGKPGMMTLISLAIIVAFVTTWAGTLGLFEVEIWWELATLITIMLLGHWLEMRSIAQARGALDGPRRAPARHRRAGHRRGDRGSPDRRPRGRRRRARPARCSRPRRRHRSSRATPTSTSR